MLSTSLLGKSNGANGHGESDLTSFNTSNSYNSDGHHPLETSRLKQKKVIPAYVYYGLIGAVAFTTLLLLIVVIAWASAKPEKEYIYVPAATASSSASVMSSAAVQTSVVSSASGSNTAGYPSSSMGPSAPAQSSPSSQPVVPSSSSQQPPPPPVNVTDAPNILLPKTPWYPINSWPGQIKTWDLLHHLSGLFSIAMQNGGTRVITMPGFNRTVEYILKVLHEQTNLVNIRRTYFTYAAAVTVTSASFKASIEGIKDPVTYTLNTDWRVPVNSRASSGVTNTVVLVLNGGCTQADYDKALGPTPPFPLFVLVKQNTNCTDANRIGFAQFAGASGLIIGLPANNLGNTRAPWVTQISVVYMTLNASTAMVNAIAFGGTSAVTINLAFTAVQNDVTISNVCGDSPVGDPTSVVVVGGHSDGVARGPGTNDDGSGSISTLALALTLTRLMNNKTVPWAPVNMVKFCWFGGEESGLLGSNEVVRVAVEADKDPAAMPGSRARDWAIMVDLDMLGSMNFMNWVYDANVYIPPSTPQRAWQGSKLLSNLFFEYFDTNNLPRDSDTFDGRSDYGPFLVAGIPAGGVDAGADKRKTADAQARYQRLTGWGGVIGAINDQCYHQPCDTIENIHWGVYTNMTQSSAYVLENLALRKDLRSWLGNPLTDEPVKGPLDHLAFEFRGGETPRTAEQLELEAELERQAELAESRMY